MIDPAVLHYCKYQERCHTEVRNKLYELGFGKEDVEYQISLLIANGVLNEERFAKAYAGGKFRMKHWGREKIRQHLRLKKVSEYSISKAMAEIEEPAYDAVFIKLAEKKAEEIRGDRSLQSRKGKLYRYLLQKGYEQKMVMDIINKLLVDKK